MMEELDYITLFDEDGNEEECEAGGLSADTTDKEKTEYE